MSDVIEWLESPEGERWSRNIHGRYPKWKLASIVDDIDDSETFIWWIRLINA